MSKATKVSDPNSKGGNGFIWGIGVLLVIIAVVIGYIVWSGQQSRTEAVAENAEDVNLNVEYTDGVVTLRSANTADDAAEVDLYEDFSCPHCAELAEGSDAEMKQAVEDGDLVVNVRTLNFLDLGGQDLNEYIEDEAAQVEGHSTKTAAVLTEIASAGDAYTYWNLRDYLMHNQQNVAGWEFDDFADAADTLGADGELVDTIRNLDVAEGNQVGRSNAKHLKDETGEVSSPRIIQDGEDLPNPSGGSLADWDWVTQIVEG